MIDPKWEFENSVRAALASGLNEARVEMSEFDAPSIINHFSKYRYNFKHLGNRLKSVTNDEIDAMIYIVSW